MKRLNDELSCDEITNPTVMSTNQMIFEDTLQQAIEEEEIIAQDVFRLEIDGTQLENWNALMEEVIIDDLPPPLHFQRTSDGIQVEHDLPIYPPVSNNWYHGPTKTIDVRPSDWKEINLAREDEEPRIIKIGSQLTDKEVQQYKDLMLEFIDVFAWSYMDLKGMPPEIVQHTIPLFPDTKPIRQILRYLVNKPDLSSRLARWILLLIEFDYTVQYKPGKMHLQVDHLSRLSTEASTEEVDDKFPNGRLFAMQKVPLWNSYIAEFLSTQAFPTNLDRNERHKIRVNSTNFAIIANKLY